MRFLVDSLRGRLKNDSTLSASVLSFDDFVDRAIAGTAGSRMSAGRGWHNPSRCLAHIVRRLLYAIPILIG